MTVWETVVAGSTLASGTFWEHLNAQGGGTGETIIVDSFVLECEMPEYEIELSEELEIELISEELILEVEDQEFELEVD